MTKFAIEYNLGNAGWATVRFIDVNATASSPVSYLNDSLGQLADMALELKRGLSDAKAVFMDEPGELQFIVDVKNGTAFYEVRRYKNYASWGMHPQDDYDVALKDECPPKRIIQQISTNLWKIYEEVGVEQYQERWGHPFPVEKYKALIA